MKEYTYNGVTYRSLSAFADANGVKIDAVRLRIKMGRDPLTDYSKNSGPSAKPYTHNGVTYKSIRAFAEAHGVPYSLVYLRVKKGLHPLVKPTSVIVFGKEHNSVKAALEYYGIPPLSYYKYVVRGSETLEQLITRVNYRRSKRLQARALDLVVRGVSYPGVKAFSKAHGRDDGSCSIRKIRAKHGCTTEEACELWLQWKESDDAKTPDREAQRIAREAKSAAHQKAMAEREAKKEVKGPFSLIKQCTMCAAIYKKRDSTNSDLQLGKINQMLVDGFCSDICRDKKEIEWKKEARKKRRLDGRDCRGDHVKRAKKKGVPWERGITAPALSKRYGMQCQMCGVDTEPHDGNGWNPRGWSVGHIVSIDEYGPHLWSNVWLECCGCNSKKGNRSLPRFAFATEDRRRQLSAKPRVRESLPRFDSFDSNQIGLFGTPTGRGYESLTEPEPEAA